MTTTILGRAYEGRPMFGSLALRLRDMEQRGDAADAQALLDAHNQIADTFGGKRIDLARQMTNAPAEGLVTCPAVRS